MRYLLDEMFPASAAEALRRSGVEARAIQEFDELWGLDDIDVFAIAQLDRRALVTENARDFVAIEAGWRERSEHYGLILTSNRAFPRHDASRFVRDFVAALVAFDRSVGRGVHTSVAWLSP